MNIWIDWWKNAAVVNIFIFIVAGIIWGTSRLLGFQLDFDKLFDNIDTILIIVFTVLLAEQVWKSVNEAKKQNSIGQAIMKNILGVFMVCLMIYLLVWSIV